MKITKEQFDKLQSENISKKEYDEIIRLIDDRFGEVVSLVNKNLVWFVYGNYDYNSADDEGWFDPKGFSEHISIGGEGNFPEPFCYSDQGFGFIYTRWLWTDDDVILKEYAAEVAEAKREREAAKSLAKQKREELKARKAAMKEIIKSKLTKEELKYIKFK